MKCKCGSKIEKGSTVCPVCGAAVPEKKGLSNKATVITAAACAAVAVAGTGTGLFFNGTFGGMISGGNQNSAVTGEVSAEVSGEAAKPTAEVTAETVEPATENSAANTAESGAPEQAEAGGENSAHVEYAVSHYDETSALTAEDDNMVESYEGTRSFTIEDGILKVRDEFVFSNYISLTDDIDDLSEISSSMYMSTVYDSYTYDSKGNLAEEYGKSGGEYSERRYEYEYDANDNTTRKRTLCLQGSMGSVPRVDSYSDISYTYDKDGNLLSDSAGNEYRYFNNGKLAEHTKGTEKTVYEYDHDSGLIVKETTTDNGAETLRIEYGYTDKGQLMFKNTYIDGKLSVGLEYSYDENGVNVSRTYENGFLSTGERVGKDPVFKRGYTDNFVMSDYMKYTRNGITECYTGFNYTDCGLIENSSIYQNEYCFILEDKYSRCDDEDGKAKSLEGIVQSRIKSGYSLEWEQKDGLITGFTLTNGDKTDTAEYVYSFDDETGLPVSVDVTFGSVSFTLDYELSGSVCVITSRDDNGNPVSGTYYDMDDNKIKTAEAEYVLKSEAMKGSFENYIKEEQ